MKLVKEKLPVHIGYIIDGNGRWAKKRALPRSAGHKVGFNTLKKIINDTFDLGIKVISIYAFSTENWNRKPEEVDFLMNLLGQTIKNELNELHSNNVVINFLGDLTKLAPKLQEILYHAVEVTRNNTGVHLQIAFNYGARDEILTATKKIAEQYKNGEITEITEDIFSNSLYTSTIPDPDLLIRTGGELRVSNYLLWQIAYSEILIIKEYWPEFDAHTLAFAVNEFHNRHRRYGK